MNPESNGPFRHPEVDANPEALIEPTDSTKQDLLRLAIEKVHTGYLTDGFSIQNLIYIDGAVGSVYVSRDQEHNDLLARISHLELAGQIYGGYIITNYSLTQTNQGLQLKKHIHAATNSNFLDYGQGLYQDDSLVNRLTRKKIALAELEAEAIEDNFSFSFVSQQEAEIETMRLLLARSIK